MNRPSIILASTSPRRIELLSQIGLQFQALAPSSEEKARRGESPRDLVRRLALEKAASVQAQHPDALIIAADTIVVSPDGQKVLGKPRDAKDAARMLRMLAGHTHTVFTGYCLLQGSGRTQRKLIRAIQSRVKMRPLSKGDILDYIQTGEPMDKAGSYAAQGKGMALIDRINGSYTNVVGLPVCQVAADLETHFGLELFKWGRK